MRSLSRSLARARVRSASMCDASASNGLSREHRTRRRVGRTERVRFAPEGDILSIFYRPRDVCHDIRARFAVRVRFVVVEDEQARVARSLARWMKGIWMCDSTRHLVETRKRMNERTNERTKEVEVIVARKATRGRTRV